MASRIQQVVHREAHQQPQVARHQDVRVLRQGQGGGRTHPQHDNAVHRSVDTHRTDESLRQGVVPLPEHQVATRNGQVDQVRRLTRQPHNYLKCFLRRAKEIHT
jgi:hypothetical protein